MEANIVIGAIILIALFVLKETIEILNKNKNN